MNVNFLDLKKTAVLFFDILNGYYHAADPVTKSRKKPMVDNAVPLMKAARSAGLPIFFAKGNHRPDNATSVTLITDTSIGLKPWPVGEVAAGPMHAISDDSSSEVIPELEPCPDDYYIPKYRWSAFYQTYLDLALRSRGIDTIIVSGGSTDVGVAATVFAARDSDYNIIVARDACATSHDQRAHDALMDWMFPRMSRVRTTEQIVQMIHHAASK
jgi:ureidoacrylate peracid hydrolase